MEEKALSSLIPTLSPWEMEQVAAISARFVVASVCHDPVKGPAVPDDAAGVLRCAVIGKVHLGVPFSSP